jgi:hypothetical protein
MNTEKNIKTSLISYLILAGVILSASSCSRNSLDTSHISTLAKEITVKVEGSTQGSGTIVSSEYSKKHKAYITKALTPKHVIGAENSSEELEIQTHDGSRYRVLNINKVFRNIDMAELEFMSNNKQNIAVYTDSSKTASGDKVYIGGYPLSTNSVKPRIFRFLAGNIVAIAKECIAGGYQLLYSNSTLPGMSGSPVINGNGQVIGIHGRGEIEATLTEQTGIAIKTGTNQGIPIGLVDNSMLCKDSQRIGGKLYANDIQREENLSPIIQNNLEASNSQVSTYVTPLLATDPTEAQLQTVLQAWLDLKAAALLQNGDTETLAAVAGPALVDRVRQQQEALLRDGLVQKVQASITSIQMVSTTPSRIEVRAQLTYHDQTLNDQSEVVDETPAGNLPVTFILGRDPDGWRLQAYIPG